MSKQPSKDLIKFLKPFPDAVQETTLKLRDFVWSAHPGCNEVIYDNYNALAIGFSTSDRAGDVFCSIAVYANYVNFGFLRGTEIADPEHLLKGSGSLYRYIKVTDFSEFPKKYMAKLLKASWLNSLARLKEGEQKTKGEIITKSVSKAKRRPKKG